MKVILVNGSLNEKGCTYTALMEVAGSLQKQGIETDIFQVGRKAVAGCLGCGVCAGTGRCFMNDPVNVFLEAAETADGFVFGSPVHFAGASGTLTPFMDRVFFHRTEQFVGKPAAAVVSCRRGGSTAAFDQINKFFTISQMPVVSSQYWNMVHGNTPEEVLEDLEGLQIMRTLGRNMAWLLKCIDAGKKADIRPPKDTGDRPWTNFIR